MGAVFPAEGDTITFDANDAGVANGGAADIGAEILNGAFAAAKGLQMHAPVFFPHAVMDGRQPGLCGGENG